MKRYLEDDDVDIPRTTLYRHKKRTVCTSSKKETSDDVVAGNVSVSTEPMAKTISKMDIQLVGDMEQTDTEYHSDCETSCYDFDRKVAFHRQNKKNNVQLLTL